MPTKERSCCRLSFASCCLRPTSWLSVTTCKASGVLSCRVIAVCVCPGKHQHSPYRSVPEFVLDLRYHSLPLDAWKSGSCLQDVPVGREKLLSGHASGACRSVQRAGAGQSLYSFGLCCSDSGCGCTALCASVQWSRTGPCASVHLKAIDSGRELAAKVDTLAPGHIATDAGPVLPVESPHLNTVSANDLVLLRHGRA